MLRTNFSAFSDAKSNCPNQFNHKILAANYYNFRIVSILFFAVINIYSYPSRSWSVLTTRHFKFYYTPETAHLAEAAGAIAEESWERLSNYFGRSSSKTIHIQLVDDHDFTNGAAHIYRPLVSLHCRSTESLLRGYRDNLRRTLTHELSHIYSMDDYKGPVLFNASASVKTEGRHSQDHNAEALIEVLRIPLWFIEAAAQLGSQLADADTLDPRRRLFLQDAARSGKLLSLNQMNRFEGTLREYELVYNQGYHFLLFLIRKYKLKNLATLCSVIQISGFYAGLYRTFGTTVPKLYDEWVRSLRRAAPMGIHSNEWQPVAGNRDIGYVFEPAAVDGGRYIIANWRHDFDRLDLYRVKSEKKTTRVIRDVGRVLVKDPVTGEIWFNKAVYRLNKGVAQYDIYRLSSKGKPVRVTRGARCMAFDVRDGLLVYAAYHKGKTHILRKKWEAYPDTLFSLPYQKPVFRISLPSADSVILSTVNDGRQSVELLSGGRLTPLFRRQDTDFSQAMAVNPDTLILVSNAQGAPGLFWCDLKRAPELLIPVRKGLCGAYMPWAERGPGGYILHAAVLNGGHLKNMLLPHPFRRTDAGIPIVSHAAPTKFQSKDLKNRKPRYITAALPPLSKIELGLATDEFAGQTDTRLISKAEATFDNASDRVAFTPRAGAQLSVNHQAPPSAMAGAEFRFSLGPLRTRFDAQWENRVYLIDNDGTQRVFNAYRQIELAGLLYFQLSQYTTLGLGDEFITRNFKLVAKLSGDYRYDNGTKRTTKSFGNIFNSNRAFIRYSHRYHRSLFDPASLGPPGRLFQLIGFFTSNTYYQGEEPFYDSLAVTDPLQYFGVEWKLEKSFLSKTRRTALRLRTDGKYRHLPQIKNSYYPGAYELPGNTNLFMGYKFGDYKAPKTARFSTEIAANPFVNILKPTTALQRFHLYFIAETGIIQVFDPTCGLLLSSPLSVSIGYRQAFHIWYNRSSFFRIQYSKALSKILKKDETIGDAFYMDVVF